MTLAPWKKIYDKPGQFIEREKIFATDISEKIVMYGCESWTIKKAEH